MRFSSEVSTTYGDVLLGMDIHENGRSTMGEPLRVVL
jgi:hypothetical protein